MDGPEPPGNTTRGGKSNIRGPNVDIPRAVTIFSRSQRGKNSYRPGNNNHGASRGGGIAFREMRPKAYSRWSSPDRALGLLLPLCWRG